MKKVVAFCLAAITVVLCLSGCGNSEFREISCDDIIAAYEEAGYTVSYHLHRDTDAETDVICNIQIVDPDNPERNYLYIDRYADEATAQTAAEEGKYNIALWLIASLYGELRWLKSEQYGEIHYHSFSREMINLFEELLMTS